MHSIPKIEMNEKEQNRAEWIKRIEDTFAGPKGLVGENSLAFSNNEIENKIWRFGI